MAEQESEWALAQLETLSASEREIVRKMANRLIRRVLYPLSQNLRVDSSPDSPPTFDAPAVYPARSPD